MKPSFDDLFISFIPVLILLSQMIVPCALLCILQYFLSKQQNPWLGRILPILSGGVSVVMFLLLIVNVQQSAGSRIWLFLLVLLLLMNLPTAAFMVVYHVTRKKFKDKRDLERMNIQDLE